MHEFKQYHQEDKTFVRETKVYFSQCNQYHVMTLAQLLDLTSVTASEDFVQRGLTFDVLVENKSVLLVSRNSFKIHTGSYCSIVFHFFLRHGIVLL